MQIENFDRYRYARKVAKRPKCEREQGLKHNFEEQLVIRHSSVEPSEVRVLNADQPITGWL